MRVDLDTRLLDVVGMKSRNALVEQLDLHTAGDLLRHYPRRYVGRGMLSEIAGLVVGEDVTLIAEVASSTLREMRSRKGKFLKVEIRDARGRTLECTFFNPQKLAHVLRPGTRALFAGRVGVFETRNKKTLQLTHPQFEPLGPDEDRPFIAVYPATKDLPSWSVGKCVRQVLDMLDEPTDPLPVELRRAERLPELGQALRRIHLPESDADVEAARRRLVWDEAMGVQLALALRREAVRGPARRGVSAEGRRPARRVRRAAAVRPHRGPARASARRSPPTSRGEHPMNRLSRATSASGKTVVALRAMLQVVDAGRQAAMLAPTEVLAAQHARSLRTLLGPLGQAGELGGGRAATRVTLLTGSLRRRRAAPGAAGRRSRARPGSSSARMR